MEISTVQIIFSFGSCQKGMYRKPERQFRSDPCLWFGQSRPKLVSQLLSPSVDFLFPQSSMASASPFLTPESETAPTSFCSLANDTYIHVNKMQVG